MITNIGTLSEEEEERKLVLFNVPKHRACFVVLHSTKSEREKKKERVFDQ